MRAQDYLYKRMYKGHLNSHAVNVRSHTEF